MLGIQEMLTVCGNGHQNPGQYKVNLFKPRKNATQYIHYIIIETAFGNMLAIQSSRDFVLINKKMPIHPVGKVSLLEDSIGDTFHVSIKRS